MKGTVKFFSSTKGFGFIYGDQNKEYFVHHSDLKEGDSIQESDSVEFDVEEGQRGPKAVNVKKTTDKTEDEEDNEENSEEEDLDKAA